MFFANTVWLFSCDSIFLFYSYKGHDVNIDYLKSKSAKGRTNMDFNLHKQAVGINELIFEGMAEQSVDSDLTLPDYCPDILRILKCTITPRVTGVQAAGDRVTVDGNALVRIIYCSEGSRVRCYEQSYPFSKHIDVKNLADNACVSIRARTDYANCRAISQRRADIHGMITLSIKITKCREEELLSGADGAGIQLQCKNLDTVSSVNDVEKPFPMSEVVEVGSDRPPVAQIIRCNAIALIDDIKTINNKILIKGDMIVSILYYGDNPDGELTNFTHSMPISQIIEIEGVNENSIIDARLIVTSLEILPKSDSSGEMRLLDISARICAVIRSYNPMEFPIVTDSYSTKYDMKIDKKTLDYLKPIDKFKDSFVCKDSFDFSGTGISNLIDQWCGDITSAATVRDDELIISGSVTVHIIYLDKDGQPNYAERQADYEYKRALRDRINRLKCDPSVLVTADNGILSSENRIDIKIELSVSAAVFSNESDRIISDIQPIENQNVKSNAALTIYFSDEGESVWNIAKRYKTTVESIISENGLKGDVITEKGKLLIPKV